ncbi:MAG TPA: FAD-binding oxidoreductase, partial [Candidatus Deferrimicrobium sp.]|nr:FAD-binding oxidoreductase [Candidatus Deferrimicrobium sp.]
MSTGTPPPLRWWGWGDRDTTVPPGLARLLRDELGVDTSRAAARPTRPPALPISALDGDPLLASLRDVCGDEAVAIDAGSRLRHATGRSYLDLLSLRGERIDAPDAVVMPAGEPEVAAVLRLCGDASCAVVPFGGGTSVVGGVSPLRGAHRAVITLDLRRLDQGVAVDPVSMTASLQAGMTGPQAETFLAGHGLTLGHFPQSFEHATLGGFAATRSAGQASSGYGRFDELVEGLRLVTPAGEIVVAGHPATAAGPSIRQLVLGSEGRLGVITELTVRVRNRPAQSRYEGWSFTTFADGLAAMRALVQGRVTPDVARLSDREETRVGMAMAFRGDTVDRIGRRYLRVRGHEQGCLLIAGWDSDAMLTGARQAQARELLRRHGGLRLGASPGRSWLRQRYQGPYLRDALLDAGVLVETLETATSWTRLEQLHQAVAGSLRGALSSGGAGALIGCHVSHIYPSGASLY